MRPDLPPRGAANRPGGARGRLSLPGMTSAITEAGPEAPARRPPFAARPVALIAAAMAVVLLATSGRYGYFADELYFIAAGRELSWGYADQPPLVPLLAAGMDLLVPGSLVAVRVPAVLSIAAGAVLTAAVARELGADRRAQAIAAGAWAVAGNFAGMGHMLATASIDPVLWTGVLWALVRWVRWRGSDLPLLWAGVLTAVAVQVKFLIPVLWLVLVPVVLVLGPRELLRRPLLWVGAAVAVLSAVPSLWWQSRHGWPQLEMREVVAAENWWGPAYVPVALLCAGIAGAGLLCLGTWALLRSPELRFLGWTFLGVTAAFVVGNGRPYYVAGFFGLLFAAGAVQLQRRREAGAAPRRCWPWFGVSAVVALAWLPVLPVSAIPPGDVISGGSIGWPQLTGLVAEQHRRQPPGAAVITHDYWDAAALRHYGPAAGLPRIYSPGRGFWYFGHPPEGTDRALYLGSDGTRLRRLFGDVRPLAVADAGLPAEAHFDGEVLWLVQHPRVPWPVAWRELRHMGLDG